MFRRITTALMAFTLSGAALFAQFGPQSTNNSGSTPAAPSPATIITQEVDRLTTLLDLSSSQAQAISGYLTTAQSTISGLQSSLSADQTKLQAAVKASTSPANYTTNSPTITSLATDIGTIRGQILDANAQATAEIISVLTSTQQMKFEKLGFSIPGGFGGAIGHP